MFKVTLDPREKYVGVTVETEEDAAHFCKAAAEIVCGVQSWDQVPENVQRVYEEYAQTMARDRTALWDRQLWEHAFQVSVAPNLKVSVTFGVLVLSKLGCI